MWIYNNNKNIYFVSCNWRKIDTKNPYDLACEKEYKRDNYQKIFVSLKTFTEYLLRCLGK